MRLGYLQVIRGGEWDQAFSELGPGQLPSSSAARSALRDNPCPTAEGFFGGLGFDSRDVRVS